jgi:glycosyltransferase involved in cell wall biosynthesis
MERTSSPRSLAFVSPRYGPGVVGGAETLVRKMAGKLAERGHKVTVLTTCATDHFTWENSLPAEEERDGGVTVRRFPVGARDVSRFLSLQQRIDLQEPISLGEQMDWLGESVVSPALFGHLRDRGDEYELIFFAPYLFGTTFWGALVRPERSVLIPCLHDEPFAHLPVFRHLFSEVAGILCNSEPEADLIRSIGGPGVKAVAVGGLGFDIPNSPANPGPFLSRHGVRTPYCLYLGRLEEGKNAPLLTGYFGEIHRLDRRAPDLLLAGAGEISIPAGSRIRGIGFLDEPMKRSALAGCLCLAQPSVNESFSIVIMESWLAGRPVLVNAACAVTAHHAGISGGGLAFSDFFELREALALLAEDPSLASRMGAAGRDYVIREYSWETIIPRYEAFMERLCEKGAAA